MHLPVLPARFLLGSAIVTAAGQNVSFDGLGQVLSILGALGGLGALIGASVVVWKGRSEKRLADSGEKLNAVQMMNVLFERQREQNLETLAQRDAEIARLREGLRHANGNRGELERQLADCVRERLVVRNQLKALEQTLADLRRERTEFEDPAD